MPAKTPRVSVILNCYNHEAYVAEAIESVLAQSFANFELILIDNGSTDGTRMILEHYDDFRILRMFFDANETLSKRLNQGVSAATGEFACVLYSDDKMLPDKLERQVAMFAALPADYGVVYCPAIGFNQQTGATWQHVSMGISGAMMPSMLIHHHDGPLDMSSPLTRTTCLRANRWHEDLFGEGEAIFLRIGIDWKFHFDPQPTVLLRDHGSNMGKAVVRNYEMFQKVIERLPAHPNFRPEWRAEFDRFAARCDRHVAWMLIRMTDNQASRIRTICHKAIKRDLRILADPRFVGAGLLSLLPSSLRRILNRFADRLRRSGENANLVDHYDGYDPKGSIAP